jgi:hypothetical protein
MLFLDINISVGYVDFGLKVGSGGVHPYAGVGGGEGYAASGSTSSGRIKTGNSTTGGACLGPELVSACYSWDQRTGGSVGVGVGDAAGIYDNQTW